MKKHLLAVAVTAAIATPAMAQNVSVYGRIGAEVTLTDTKGGTSATTMTGGTTQLGTSLLGFRGAEDLGGGMKAEFNLEGGLATENGALGTVTANTTTGVAAGSNFNRHSWVGLTGGFGSIKIGRTNTAMKDLDGYSDAGANLFDNEGANFSILNTRAPRQIRYDSPTFNGLNIAVSHSQENADAGGNTGPEINAYRISYNAGPLSVAIAYGTESPVGQTYKESATALGGSYDLGILTVFGAYAKQDTSATASVNYKSLGVAIPMGSGITARLAAQKESDTAQTSTDVRRMGVLLDKAFSKRTSIYAAYRNDDFGTGGTDATVSAIGINHAF